MVPHWRCQEDAEGELFSLPSFTFPSHTHGTYIYLYGIRLAMNRLIHELKPFQDDSISTDAKLSKKV